MYLEFFGFREPPFELTPNPRFLFLTPRHREALTALRHAMSTGKGLAVLIGEAGTGKTTLIRTALEDQNRHEVLPLYLNNPALTRDEFVELLGNGFGLTSAARHSKAALLVELEPLLKHRQELGVVTALVIDEAQSLPLDLLEEIRLLANIETADAKLLTVVLAGQPELADRLNESSLRQLKQRIALRCELAPLSLSETASYIAARIRVAGGDTTRVFTREAVALIHERSAGIPRVISVICDNALITGFALDRRPVTSEIVQEVCRDFDLQTGRRISTHTPAAPSHAAAPAPAGAQVADAAAGADAVVAATPGRRRMFSFF